MGSSSSSAGAAGVSQALDKVPALRMNTWNISGHTHLPRRKIEIIKAVFVYKRGDVRITGGVLSTPNGKDRTKLRCCTIIQCSCNLNMNCSSGSLPSLHKCIIYALQTTEKQLENNGGDGMQEFTCKEWLSVLCTLQKRWIKVNMTNINTILSDTEVNRDHLQIVSTQSWEPPRGTSAIWVYQNQECLHKACYWVVESLTTVHWRY